MMMTLYQVTLDFTQGAEEAGLPGAGTSFGEWISRILGAVIAIGAILVLLYLVWGGISWITAGGDASKVQKARDRMVQAVIGIIVLASTLAIFGLVQTFLGIEVLNFGSSDTNQNLRNNPLGQPSNQPLDRDNEDRLNQ